MNGLLEYYEHWVENCIKECEKCCCFRNNGFCECVEANVLEHLYKLSRYQQLEEQGLLLRLPCKVGNFVYRIANQRDNFTDEEYKIVIAISFSLDMINSIGKTVFLTRKEAEKALAEMKGE